ncbi:hypothetical protein BN1708_020478, partial [Verticillium longisporum]
PGLGLSWADRYLREPNLRHGGHLW